MIEYNTRVPSTSVITPLFCNTGFLMEIWNKTKQSSGNIVSTKQDKGLGCFYLHIKFAHESSMYIMYVYTYSIKFNSDYKV